MVGFKEVEEKVLDKPGGRERTVTESSLDSEFSMLEGVLPLTLDDLVFQHGYMGVEDNSPSASFDPTASGRLFSAVQSLMGRKRKRVKGQVVVKASPAKQRWLRAVRLVRERGDPWAKFHLDIIPTDRAKRHRYSPLTQSWTTDDCEVRMERVPFAHGAMRECFRMKKLSNFSNSNNWARDSNNYVAKSYMIQDEETRDSYFQDVKLQMDAKLWAEEYNRHKPPKKVDIFMMAVLELVDRPGAPLFHVEHYMDGPYIKYNSNSGFVDDKHGPERSTPQALSHFTFERSGHQLVVVDIQGVGDLYTDPQIHTASGTEYGDGNLGTQGMALFFHSHRCNQICSSLGLTQFDLSRSELAALSDTEAPSCCSETRVKLEEVVFCETPSFKERADFSKFFRSRCQSSASYSEDGCGDSSYSSRQVSHTEEDDSCFVVEDCGVEEGEAGTGRRGEQEPWSSASSTDSALGWGGKREVKEVKVIRPPRVSRPSCISAEVLERKVSHVGHHVESVLGRVHLDLAKYHETCRFDASVQDTASALFHLKAAADCGNLAGMLALSQIYTGRPNDILPAITEMDAAEHVAGSLEDIAVDYIVTAARMGDASSMVYLAQAFDSGLNLGTDREQSSSQAVSWYLLASEAGAERRCCLMARAADLLCLQEGGCFDPRRGAELYEEAAEAAMEEMKGKLATKYYCQAEEAWSMVEE